MKKSAVKSAVSPQANGLATTARNEIVVYQPDETIRLDVRLENETVWLTQLKIAELFGVQKAAISKHIKNIFASGEPIKMQEFPKWKQFRTREYAGRLTFAVSKMDAMFIPSIMERI